jgi:hypothetical protein
MAGFDRGHAVVRLTKCGALSSACSRCGDVEWQVGDRLSSFAGLDPVDWTDDNSNRAHKVMVPVVCMRCGNTRHHDWRVLRP